MNNTQWLGRMLLLIGLLMNTNLHAQQTGKAGPEAREIHRQELKSRIPGITDQQIRQLEQVRKKYRAEHMELRLQTEKLKAQKKDLHDREHAEVASFLNEEQMKALDAMRKEKHMQRRGKKAEPAVEKRKTD